MLGYRSFFHVQDTPNFVETAVEGVSDWFQSKKWQAGNLQPDQTAVLAPGVIGALQRTHGDDGSSTDRFTITQNHTTGIWTTEITIHASTSPSFGWFLLDIDHPAGEWISPPQLTRDLISTLPARDGSGLLTPNVAVLERGGERSTALSTLVDPDRRGLLFLANANSRLPIDRWCAFVERVVSGTVGLASTFVLDSEAAAEFNNALPATHHVQPGTIRAFLPNVNLTDPADGLRHRAMTARTLVDEWTVFLRNTLERRAQLLSITAPLPGHVVETDRILRGELDTMLLDRALREAATETAVPSPFDAMGPLGASMAALPEVDRITPTAFHQLADLAAEAQRAMSAENTRAQDALRLRFAELEQRTSDTDMLAGGLRAELDALHLELAITHNEHAGVERRLRLVQQEMSRLGHADAAWNLPEPNEDDRRPDDFETLLEKMSDLPHVVFTGDTNIVLGLADNDPLGIWAGKIWDALLAANDYAALQHSAGWNGDLHTYLVRAPAGCRSYSAQRHARNESNDVQTRPKFRNQRMLAVPAEVDPAGTVFMGAHFKIAQSGMLSPRVHYCDDTAKTGKIYVGYIGPHLTTSRTT